MAKTSMVKGFEGRKMWLFFSGLSAVITAAVVFGILQGVTSTSTYYVLNQDVGARELITVEMLEPKQTNSEPPVSLPYATVLNGGVYSKISLKAGEVLTESNAGSLDNLIVDVPEDFVLASFKAQPSEAVGGKVIAGEYIDLILISQTGAGAAASYFMQKVLVVDATIDLDSAAGEESSDAGVYRQGILTLFTVALSKEDAVKLALATRSTLYVVKSPQSTVENGAEPLEYIIDEFALLEGPALDSTKKSGTPQGTEGTDGNSGSTDGVFDTTEPEVTPTEEPTLP